MSCFLRDGGDIFHTYSTYARGTDQLGSTYTLLDLTALGRQEDWEEPKGRAPRHGADPPSRTDPGGTAPGTVVAGPARAGPGHSPGWPATPGSPAFRRVAETPFNVVYEARR